MSASVQRTSVASPCRDDEAFTRIQRRPCPWERIAKDRSRDKNLQARSGPPPGVSEIAISPSTDDGKNLLLSVETVQYANPQVGRNPVEPDRPRLLRGLRELFEVPAGLVGNDETPKARNVWGRYRRDGFLRMKPETRRARNAFESGATAPCIIVVAPFRRNPVKPP